VKDVRAIPVGRQVARQISIQGATDVEHASSAKKGVSRRSAGWERSGSAGCFLRGEARPSSRAPTDKSKTDWL
jgi:hypothetical protein